MRLLRLDLVRVQSPGLTLLGVQATGARKRDRRPRPLRELPVIKLHRYHAAHSTTRVDFGAPINLTWRAEGAANFDLKEDTARRLTVCWNVCEGIPTDVLEGGYLLDLSTAIARSDLAAARLILKKLDRQIDRTDDRLHDCPSCHPQTATSTATTKAKRKKPMKTTETEATTTETTETEKLTTGATAPEAKASKKAFDFERTSMYVADPMELCIVGGQDLPPGERGPLDTDNDNLAHPLYDERIDLPLTEEFILNVNAYGVLVPISICKIDGLACVVAGRQRVRAARVVNARRKKSGEAPLKIECKIQRTNENRLLGVMITENEARQQDSHSVKMSKLRRLMERGVSAEDAAITFKIKPATVKSWLAFDDTASDALKIAVDDEKIPLTSGIELSRIKDPEKQKEALRGMLAGAEKDKASGKKTGKGNKKTGVAAARKAAKKAQNPDSSGGLTNRRTQRKLLELIKKVDHPRARPRSPSPGGTASRPR